MKKYIVREGETMWNISKETGVRLNLLMAANPQVQDPNQLKPGSVLVIPELAKKSPSGGQAAVATKVQPAGSAPTRPPVEGAGSDSVPPFFGFVWPHVVQQGETWHSIARMYHINPRHLLSFNARPGAAEPQPGRVVYIPGMSHGAHPHAIPQTPHHAGGVPAYPDGTYGQPGMMPGAYPDGTYGQRGMMPGAYPDGTYGQPGMMPGAYPGGMYGQPGMMPGAYPGGMYGQPGMMPGAYPGGMYGQPGMMPGAYPGGMYGQPGMPGAYPGDTYGEPGMMPGTGAPGYPPTDVYQDPGATPPGMAQPETAPTPPYGQGPHTHMPYRAGGPAGVKPRRARKLPVHPGYAPYASQWPFSPHVPVYASPGTANLPAMTPPYSNVPGAGYADWGESASWASSSGSHWPERSTEKSEEGAQDAASFDDTAAHPGDGSDGTSTTGRNED